MLGWRFVWALITGFYQLISRSSFWLLSFQMAVWRWERRSSWAQWSVNGVAWLLRTALMLMTKPFQNISKWTKRSTECSIFTGLLLWGQTVKNTIKLNVWCRVLHTSLNSLEMVILAQCVKHESGHYNRNLVNIYALPMVYSFFRADNLLLELDYYSLRTSRPHPDNWYIYNANWRQKYRSAY